MEEEGASDGVEVPDIVCVCVEVVARLNNGVEKERESRGAGRRQARDAR